MPHLQLGIKIDGPVGREGPLPKEDPLSLEASLLEPTRPLHVTVIPV